MLKVNDLRDQSFEELEAILGDTRRELFVLRNDAKMNKKNGSQHEMKIKRKNIARILTILCEKKVRALEVVNGCTSA